MSGSMEGGVPCCDDAPEARDGLQPAPPHRPSLKALAIRGSTWTLLEYALSQGLRLLSNVILSRLLFPEVFGIMFLVSVFMQALEMFSDLGIGQSVIQNKRGEEKDFLDTAFTLQVLRGFVLFVCGTLVAWPAAWIYGKHELLYLIPVTALGAIFTGFGSANYLLLNRRMWLARLALINLGTQVFTICYTVYVAWLWPSVWALVLGGVTACAVKFIATHTLCPGPRDRFRWDKEAACDLFHFGRWIFVSTLFGFLASRGDQLILGYFLPTAFFGVYGFASFISQGAIQALYTIANRVLFPVYSRLAESGPEHLRAKMFRVRAVLMVVSVPPVCVLAIFGPQLVGLLYDARYQDAGWILQILAAGGVASVIGSTTGPVLLAVGDSFRFMILMAARMTFLLLAMALGGYFFGMKGLIVGVAAPDLMMYPVLTLCIRKHGVWFPWLDLAGFSFAALCIGIGWMLWN
ncbi:MAG: lipopolysaccharide biosynthesis protein [Candidatus Hydrogenedentes bacterium]|nr:lipopolysaccharide biosynthesis protein [Candidatus Hydrogenedentota bacterium]